MSTTAHTVQHEAKLPSLVASPASTIGSTFGVPAPVVAMVMLAALGGILSGSRRLFISGQPQPLGLHIVLVGLASPESGRWLDLITKPLHAEVDRLKSTARQNVELPTILARHLDQLKTLQRGAQGYATTLKAARDMAVLCEPYLIAQSDVERDGLRAQVVMADLEAMVLGNDAARAAKLAASFFGDEGLAATVISTVNPNVARRLAKAPIVTATPGWPVLVLTQSGEPFGPTTDNIIKEAFEAWSDLVRRALRLRYELPQLVELSPAALDQINSFREKVERDYLHHGAAVTCRFAVPALARLAAAHQLLDHRAEGDDSVRAIEPLVEWVLKAQDSLFPGNAAKPCPARRRMPKRATIADDLDRVRRLLEERPTLTDRQAIQILGKRPRGHWKMILEAARSDLANRTTNVTHASNT